MLQKKTCEDGSQGFGSSFEDETFRHMLSEKRTIILNGTITGNLIERVVIPIIAINEIDDELEDNKSFDRRMNPIKVFINTNGGDAEQTLSAMSAMMSSKTPIHTYAMAKAYSGGFYMLLAGHKRYCQRFSTLMYHQVQTGIPFSDMTSGKEHIEESVRLQTILDKFVLARTKLRQKQINEINSRKVDWFLGAEDALKFGIVEDIFY